MAGGNATNRKRVFRLIENSLLGLGRFKNCWYLFGGRKKGPVSLSPVSLVKTLYTARPNFRTFL